MGGELVDRGFGDLAGGQHHPHGARLFQRVQQVREVAGAGGAFAGDAGDRFRAAVIDHAMVAGARQAHADVAAHAAQADYA